MAEPLRITVGSSTADINPFADIVEPNLFADPIELDKRSRDLVIRTIFGEDAARNDESRSAIGNVIRNRVTSGRYGTGAEGVIKKPWAFEPWMRADARARMLGLREDDPNYQNIAKVVDDIFKGVVKDPTQGATHFYAPRAQAQLGRNVPAWAKGAPLANVGGHLFYAPDQPRGGSSSPPANRGGTAPPSAALAVPPTISPDDQQSMVALASNKITPGNPFLDTATPAPPPQSNVTPKQPLPPDVKPPISQSEAFGQGVQQGVTFGWSDELQGLSAALATIPGGGNASDLLKLAWGTYSQNPNDQTAQAFNTAVAEARRALAEAKQHYPGTVLGGELAGGAVVPLPGGPLTGVGRSVAARVGSGALQGGIAGGVTGAGSAEGDISQRVGPAAIGAGAGSVVGGGVGAIGPAIANYLGRALYGLAAPQRQAQAQIARTATQAVGTPERILKHEMTPDTMVADVLGEPGRVLARSVKNIDPTAAAILQEPLERRAAGQLPRLRDFLESHFGPLGDNEMARLAVKAEQAQVTTPLYQSVMQQFPSGVASPRLIQLLQGHQRLNAAGEKALREIGDQAAVERRVTPGVDSLEFWDATKRVIDGQIKAAKATPGAADDVAALTQLKRVLLNEIDTITGGAPNVGPYANARAVSEEYFGIDRAIKEGQRFIKTNIFTTPQAENAMRGMSPDAQEAFRKAAVSQFLDKMGPVNDSHNLWKNIRASDDAKKKMNFLFNGDQRAINQFEAMHHVERLQERLREAVRGNSTTAQQLIAAGAVGGGGLGYGAFTGATPLDPTTPGGAATWAAGAAALRKGANYRMAEHLAQMLVSKDPDLITKAVNAAAGDARMMNVLRQMAENMLSRTGGAATGRSIGD